MSSNTEKRLESNPIPDPFTTALLVAEQQEARFASLRTALAAARRERDHLRDLLREALSTNPPHSEDCQRASGFARCICWIAEAAALGAAGEEQER